jgi:hypothetical protein
VAPIRPSSASDSGGGTSWTALRRPLSRREPARGQSLSHQPPVSCRFGVPLRGVAPIRRSSAPDSGGGTSWAVDPWRSPAGALWLALSGWRSLVNALSGAPAALTPFVEFGSLNLRFSYGHGLCLSCLDTWRSLCGALCLALSAWLSSLRLRSWSDRGWRLPDSPTVIRDVLAEPRGLTSGALQPSSPFAVGNTSSPPCAVLHNRRSVL